MSFLLGLFLVLGILFFLAHVWRFIFIVTGLLMVFAGVCGLNFWIFFIGGLIFLMGNGTEKEEGAKS